MQRTRKLTGRHVLWLLVGFFALVVSTGIGFTVLAVQSFRGEDIKQSYRQGLDYNTTLADREAGAALGWTVSYNLTDAKALVLRVSGADGQPVHDLSLTGRLRHPTDTAGDKPLAFTRDGDSLFRADLSNLTGHWTLEGVASQGDAQLRFRRDLSLP